MVINEVYMKKIIKKVKLRTDSRGGIFFRIPISIVRLLNLAPGSIVDTLFDLENEQIIIYKHSDEINN